MGSTIQRRDPEPTRPSSSPRIASRRRSCARIARSSALDLAVGLGHGCPVGLRLDDEVARAEPAERERVGRVGQAQRELEVRAHGRGCASVHLEVEQRATTHAPTNSSDEEREQREAEARCSSAASSGDSIRAAPGRRLPRRTAARGRRGSSGTGRPRSRRSRRRRSRQASEDEVAAEQRRRDRVERPEPDADQRA